MNVIVQTVLIVQHCALRPEDYTSMYKVSRRPRIKMVYPKYQSQVGKRSWRLHVVEDISKVEDKLLYTDLVRGLVTREALDRTD